MAGIKIDAIKSFVDNKDIGVARIMPNTLANRQGLFRNLF